jgi:SulP family sulfate permease
MILAALLFIGKVVVTTTVSVVTEATWMPACRTSQDKEIPEYVRIVRIHGPFLFSATEKLQVVLDEIDSLPPIVILRLPNMTVLDATGLHEGLPAFTHPVRRS